MAVEHMGVRNGLALITATFGGEIDSWQRRAYERTLAGIANDVLMAGVQRLIDEASAGRKFYPIPTAPDWKAACAALISEKRQHAAKIHLSDCTHPGNWIEDEHGRMRRCPCWNRAMSAMEMVGQAIALPAHHPEDAA